MLRAARGQMAPVAPSVVTAAYKKLALEQQEFHREKEQIEKQNKKHELHASIAISRERDTRKSLEHTLQANEVLQSRIKELERHARSRTPPRRHLYKTPTQTAEA